VPNIKEILIPKKSPTENRHFGFVICQNKKAQQKLLKMGKLKGSKLKLDFSEYNPKAEEEEQANVSNFQDDKHQNTPSSGLTP